MGGARCDIVVGDDRGVSHPNGGAKYTTPAHVALIFAMEPVFAALTAYLWAGERLSPSAWLGGAAILAGMIFAELPSMRLWGRRWREKRNIPS